MKNSSTPEDTIAKCKRRVDECYALLKGTIVPRVSPGKWAPAQCISWHPLPPSLFPHSGRPIRCRSSLNRASDRSGSKAGRNRMDALNRPS
jgi:hypothetical protein